MKKRRVPALAPSLLTLLREVFLGLVIYDLLFFLGHNLLHRVPFLYSRIHRKHHSMTTVRAGDAIRHSFLDGSWDVACAVIALNLLQAHCLSRSLFNAIAIYLITEAHCGLNLPWMPANVIPFGLLAGPVAHDLHHQRGGHNFQKFFTYLDRLFGTYRAGPRSFAEPSSDSRD